MNTKTIPKHITHRKLVATLCKSGEDIIAGLTPGSAHLAHMALGYVGEVCELREAMANNPCDKHHVWEEIGDACFFLEGIVQGASLDRREIKAIGKHIGRFHGIMARRVVVTAGYVVDALKKHAIYVQPLQRVALTSAVAESYIVLEAIAKSYGTTLAKCKKLNIKKLQVRYGTSYSDAAAKARKDKA